MGRVAIVDPPGDEPERRGGVGQEGEADTVPPQRLHERLGDAVALRRANGRETRHEAWGRGDAACILGGAAGPVVGRALDRARRAVGSESIPDGGKRRIVDVGARDAGVRCGDTGDALPVEGVSEEGGLR